MGHVIPLHGEPHERTQALLPWYVNGTLEPEEHGAVEAHLAECAECRAELEAERVLAAEAARVPMDAESGWATLRGRLDRQRAEPPAQGSFLRRPVAIGWAVAAQAAMLLVVVGLTRLPGPQDAAPYQALGSAPEVPAGNVVVIFRPETSEQDMRGALLRSSARLVDGPTASNAYILRVGAERRAAALAELRASRSVVLAEPIDAPVDVGPGK
jgi:hypothetical protein